MTNMTDIIEAVEAVVAAAEVKPTKKKAKKPTVAPAATPEEIGAKAPAKSEPVTFHGFELKADVDTKALEEDTKALAEAVDAINRKDADLLSSYLTIGKAASKIAPLFKSTKLYGQYLAQEVPATQTLDPALRSNCKWLYEALNVKEADGSDLLKVLGVNRIESFKSGNPTVIKREYKNAVKKAEALDKCQAMGIDAEDADEALASMAKAAKEAKEAEAVKEAKALRSAITGWLNAVAKANIMFDDVVGDINSLLQSALFDPKADTMALLKDYTKAIKASK